MWYLASLRTLNREKEIIKQPGGWRQRILRSSLQKQISNQEQYRGPNALLPGWPSTREQTALWPLCILTFPEEVGHWCVKQTQLSCETPKLGVESEILERTIISIDEHGSRATILNWTSEWGPTYMPLLTYGKADLPWVRNEVNDNTTHAKIFLKWAESCSFTLFR